MRTIAIAISMTLFAAAAVAQQAPAQKLYTSASDVQGMIAKSKAERKDQPTIASPLIRNAPYNVNLEYRASIGPAAAGSAPACRGRTTIRGRCGGAACWRSSPRRRSIATPRSATPPRGRATTSASTSSACGAAA